MNAIYNVTFSGDDLTEMVMVEAENREDAGYAAEYELFRGHPEIVSLRDAGLTIQSVETVNPFSPEADAFLEERYEADYGDMVSDLRYGG